MKVYQSTDLQTLTPDEIQCVGGSVRTIGKLPRAQDMHGNTISMEEYMDLQLGIMKTGQLGSLHDFYSKGFNAGKPNILTDPK
ncbi:hypothetical protein [Granulosicoccus antarcticus]|uniref:Uncharacterized protein n=1 Tax=Granulosicoccus antarcticus IMCC3135 TaxID=1192854 RepID=A0A2Z2NQE3_9GAMM|nr:hypothetical protein [Granulosicoccus antarcticus]ASJ73602.1 hypothetical protein IMCC3135_17615 [Granulosicoccus antarcticus IMCC3135]